MGGKHRITEAPSGCLSSFTVEIVDEAHLPTSGDIGGDDDGASSLPPASSGPSWVLKAALRGGVAARKGGEVSKALPRTSILPKSATALRQTKFSKMTRLTSASCRSVSLGRE